MKGAEKFRDNCRRIWSQEEIFSKDGRVLEQVYIPLGVIQEKEGLLDLFSFEIQDSGIKKRQTWRKITK